MTIQRCLRCDRLWSHTYGPRERFTIITRICAVCVAAAFPVVAG